MSDYYTNLIHVFIICVFSGPGTYETDVVDPAKTGLMVTRDTRFKDKVTNENPGPGAYEVSLLRYWHSLLFNIS